MRLTDPYMSYGREKNVFIDCMICIIYDDEEDNVDVGINTGQQPVALQLAMFCRAHRQHQHTHSLLLVLWACAALRTRPHTVSFAATRWNGLGSHSNTLSIYVISDIFNEHCSSISKSGPTVQCGWLVVGKRSRTREIARER